MEEKKCAWLKKPDRAACAALLEEIAETPQAKSTAAFLISLSDFKSFNDIFGRHYGDLLLEKIIDYLGGFASSRVERCGGVDFLVLLSDTDYLKAEETADAICERFNDTWHIGNMDFVSAMSLGALLPPLRAERGEALLDNLEDAVREAYLAGQNSMAVYDSKLREKMTSTKAIATKLKNALATPDDPDLEVCFRPTVLYTAHRYTRAESYIRLYSDCYGLVSEATLLPIAEQSGLACALNLYAIRHTCQMIRQLLDAGRDFETIAVPVSAVQFLQPNFDQDLAAMLEEYKVPAEKLALELNEETLITNGLTQMAYMMEKISRMGVELVLSDFGTGYSGLNNVLNLPVSVLKLDRLFILQMENDQRTAAVVAGLIEIAHKLGMKVIAEGVENDFQRERLASFGCDYQQGFYYSATVHAKELLEMLSMPPEKQGDFE